jgi:molybdopterin molybdotransferase
MKPGKPIWFGRRGATLVFGLPGNPVSSYVGFRLFVEPALRARAGATEPLPRLATVRLAGRLKVLRDREAWHPVTLEPDERGWIARPVASTGSGDLASLGQAEALALTAAGGPPAEEGALLPALLLPSF